MFIEKFILPNEDEEFNIAYAKRKSNGGYLDNGYPCMLFTPKNLTEIDFAKITIFYGSNGSGKSTLLNIIANKLQLCRSAPYNSSELFESYVKICRFKYAFDDFGKQSKITKGSKIITSDDIFDYMLAVRTVNEEVAENLEYGKTDFAALKFGETLKFKGMEDFEQFRKQVVSRKKSVTRRQFLKKFVGDEVKLCSNGETALDYFDQNLSNDMLYCLDEPENSLSPQRQLELKALIETKARYCNCQFVIATHSPFMLALRGAKIYDLDTVPVSLKSWWEVENAKIYFNFFYNNKHLFLNQDDEG